MLILHRGIEGFKLVEQARAGREDLSPGRPAGIVTPADSPTSGNLLKNLSTFSIGILLGITITAIQLVRYPEEFIRILTEYIMR